MTQAFKVCPECGQTIPISATHCGRCGKMFQAAALHKRSAPLIACCIALAVLIVIGLVVAFLLFPRPHVAGPHSLAGRDAMRGFLHNTDEEFYHKFGYPQRLRYFRVDGEPYTGMEYYFDDGRVEVAIHTLLKQVSAVNAFPLEMGEPSVTKEGEAPAGPKKDELPFEIPKDKD